MANFKKKIKIIENEEKYENKEGKMNINWDSGAYRKLPVTIDKSYFRKNIFCIF